MKILRGKNAILTGASRGLGPYIADALAAEGVNLVLAARSADGLLRTQSAVEAHGVRAVVAPCDVSSRDDLERLVDTAERELGPIDILVNNAGVMASGALSEISFDEIDAVLRTNLSACIWLTKMVLPGMIQRRRGAVVNVSSMAGKVGIAYESIYAASKHGLNGFTDSIRCELDGTGVTAGVVCPTFVSGTGIWADAEAGKAPLLAREVSPEKVAAAVMKAVHGTPEALVTFGPMRPLILLLEAAPRLRVPALKYVGVTRAWKRAADVRARERGEREREVISGRR
ncbi:MAG: SDR family NAD(P)-dependent oxidoreductase [Chloroflexota bacterium]|nr:SDR family NAD(P)-dependent oxidoreductase [Chloroflexota bacterium]